MRFGTRIKFWCSSALFGEVDLIAMGKWKKKGSFIL